MKYAATEIKIDKTVPVPPKGHKNGMGLKGILQTMAVGDSFVLPLEKYGNYRSVHALAGQAGIKITVRADQKKKTFRVWKIAGPIPSVPDATEKQPTPLINQK